MKNIAPRELAQWLADPARTPPLLLDVREPWEAQICRIDGSELVPMHTVPAAAASLDPARPIVCVCHVGARSAQVTLFLMRQGFAEVYNLTGGVDGWARQVDPAMPTY